MPSHPQWRKEQVVVEPPTTSADAATPVAPGEADFMKGKLLSWKFMIRELTCRVTFVGEQGSR